MRGGPAAPDFLTFAGLANLGGFQAASNEVICGREAFLGCGSRGNIWSLIGGGLEASRTCI
jgi:hypothetical protein